MSDRSMLMETLPDLAREAGEAILEIVRRGFDVEAKGDSSPVTEADRDRWRVDDAMEALRSALPPLLEELARA